MVADAGAVISEDGRYRYRLWRWFAVCMTPLLFPTRHHPPAYQDKRVLWIMLNPSTADGQEDDPTIRKCMGFAARWEYGGVEVVNLYAFRATKPTALWEASEPVGPENDMFIFRALEDKGVGKVVVAWGASGGIRTNKRATAVIKSVRFYGHKPECLGVTRSGEPLHPLMVPYKTPPMEFRQMTAGR